MGCPQVSGYQQSIPQCKSLPIQSIVDAYQYGDGVFTSILPRELSVSVMDELNDKLDEISDLIDESLDSELTREEVIQKIKAMRDVVEAEEEEEAEDDDDSLDSNDEEDD